VTSRRARGEGGEQASLFGEAPPGESVASAGADRLGSPHLPPDPGAAGRAGTPLAERLRPRSLERMLGQAHLLSAGSLLARAIEADRVPSMILWGPPGCGKTSLAHAISERTRARFVAFSAVLGSVADLRKLLDEADKARRHGARTLLFVDEIHRFHKGQQDAFLPWVEKGVVTLVGATTENPSFSVVGPLLSRCRVFRLEPLGEEALVALLERGLAEAYEGALTATAEALGALARAADGDGRRALGLLEAVADDALSRGASVLEGVDLGRAGLSRTLLHDKSGDSHHDLASAFIKSMRGSDPDAAMYWMMRLLDAGDDPLFVLRRMMVFASEDVGNADPRALELAVAADQAYRRMGMPEGLYPLTQAALYLANAPKSNSCKTAWQRARALVEAHGALAVPLHLRNAPTRLLEELGHGAGYRYPHDEPGGIARGVTYLPDALVGEVVYQPADRGAERAVGERLRERRGR
jgi:putative ATPase